MSNLIHQPHDKLLKEMLGHVPVAKEFFEKNLPEILLSEVDLSTLSLEKEIFLDASMKASAADLLYKAKLHNGNTSYFYLLCENESKIKKDMPIRFMEMSSRILREHWKKEQGKPLPIVYPILIYAVKKHWNAPLSLGEMYGSSRVVSRVNCSDSIFID